MTAPSNGVSNYIRAPVFFARRELILHRLTLPLEGIRVASILVKLIIGYSRPQLGIQHDIANRMLVRKEHDHAVDAES